MEWILTVDEIVRQPDWAEQMAELTRRAWTGDDGRCYFPYFPLTTVDYWRETVAARWQAGSLLSWSLWFAGQPVAHAALVNQGEYWELGRWLALPTAPHGAVTELSRLALGWARKRGWPLQVECTQAHSTSQFICEQLGLRFAGLGVLAEIDGIAWDIVYYDSLADGPFEPRAGVLGDPLGQEMTGSPGIRRRLREIDRLITTDRGGGLPPNRFHLLPHLVEPVREIIRLNL